MIEKTLELAQKCHYEKEHSHQVTKLALMLFDELKNSHGLNEQHRLWLECAGLLHDIGWVNGRKEHHKTSRDLILKSSLIDWPDDEKVIVALVARYHRRAVPSDKHKYYGELSLEQKEIVRKLAAFLRIADGLDRRHISSVKNLTCRVEASKVVIIVQGEKFYEMEREAALEKSDLFKDVFEKSVEVDFIAL